MEHHESDELVREQMREDMQGPPWWIIIPPAAGVALVLWLAHWAWTTFMSWGW